jgi:transcriptional regulator with XRE-family HTH domain
MNSPREDWPRLGSYVVSARKAAGYKDRRALERATGISERTLGKLENGLRVGADTLAAVAEKVHWTPDSPRLVLAGGEPKDADTVTASVHHIGTRRPPDDDGFIRPQYEPSLEEFAREQERLRPDVSHRDIAYAVDVKYLGQLYAESQERIRELEAELARKETENERLRGDLKRAHLRVTG